MCEYFYVRNKLTEGMRIKASYLSWEYVPTCACAQKMEKHFNPDDTLTQSYDLLRGCARICCQNANAGNITK